MGVWYDRKKEQEKPCTRAQGHHRCHRQRPCGMVLHGLSELTAKLNVNRAEGKPRFPKSISTRFKSCSGQDQMVLLRHRSGMHPCMAYSGHRDWTALVSKMLVE